MDNSFLVPQSHWGFFFFLTLTRVTRCLASKYGKQRCERGEGNIRPAPCCSQRRALLVFLYTHADDRRMNRGGKKERVSEMGKCDGAFICGTDRSQAESSLNAGGGREREMDGQIYTDGESI